jgi:hypothetical protein
MSKLKASTKITVSGMGMCINYEMEIIRKAFAALGIDVVIENKFPDKEKYTEEEMKESAKFRKESFNITLVADHQPWGG